MTSRGLLANQTISLTKSYLSLEKSDIVCLFIVTLDITFYSKKKFIRITRLKIWFGTGKITLLC